MCFKGISAVIIQKAQLHGIQICRMNPELCTKGETKGKNKRGLKLRHIDQLLATFVATYSPNARSSCLGNNK